MRVLLYGMQSSGASLVTYFLGQQPGSVALVDIWARHLAPWLPAAHVPSVVAKCVVTMQYDFEDHARRFQPDRTILVLRHPVQNYASLERKEYVDEGGPLDEKFVRLERIFAERERFDLTLTYEAFVQDPETTIASLRGIGLSAEPEYYRFRRSVKEITKHNRKHHPWCRDRLGHGWGFGNVQPRALDASKLYRPVPSEVENHVRALCPSVSAYYDEAHPSLAEAVPGAGRTGARLAVHSR